MAWNIGGQEVLIVLENVLRGGFIPNLSAFTKRQQAINILEDAGPKNVIRQQSLLGAFKRNLCQTNGNIHPCAA